MAAAVDNDISIYRYVLYKYLKILVYYPLSKAASVYKSVKPQSIRILFSNIGE